MILRLMQAAEDGRRALDGTGRLAAIHLGGQRPRSRLPSARLVDHGLGRPSGQKRAAIGYPTVGMINALQHACITNNSRLPSEVVQQPMVQATFPTGEHAESRIRSAGDLGDGRSLQEKR